MKRVIGLAFLPNQGGDSEGLSDAGVETFRDNPFAAVARETGQNSRDARDKNTEPVRLSFDVLKVPSNKFPDLDQYREAAVVCLQKARRLKKEKDIGFFTQALKVMHEPVIEILRISDFNTRGVRGPCEEGNPFHTLAKADGVTDKEEIDSGGSFGIGKNAVFALSDIQTAFFSTRFEDMSGKVHVLCMGKTLFISHKGNDGEEKRRKGYWGKLDGYMPLDNPADIPDWLRRDTKGTSIFSVGMRQNPTDWRYEMTAALLMNFFTAIERQEMEFEIDAGTIKINRNTIQGLFQDANVNKAVGQLKASEAFKAACTLHTVLVDDATGHHMLRVPDLGDVHLHMLLRDGLAYTVGIVRNGMYITDNLANFNEPFKRFPLHQDFAVIIEPASKNEGEWFKRLEGPKHNDLSAGRITDPEMRATGQKAFENLAHQVRETIRSIAKAKPTDTLELDELNDLFASDQTRKEDDEGTEPDPRSFKPSPVKPVPPKTPPKKRLPGSDSIIPQPEPEPHPNPKPNPEPPPPEPGPILRPGKLEEPVNLERERATIPDRKNPKIRRLMFTSPTAGNICVIVAATGLTEADDIKIIGTDQGDVTRGALFIHCEKGKRMSVNVELESAYEGAIEIHALKIEEKKELEA